METGPLPGPPRNLLVSDGVHEMPDAPADAGGALRIQSVRRNPLVAVRTGAATAVRYCERHTSDASIRPEKRVQRIAGGIVGQRGEQDAEPPGADAELREERDET